ASTWPPTKKPIEKFMYAAVRPPIGPSTKMPRASSSAWYFHVPGAGSQVQRGTEWTRAAAATETAFASPARIGFGIAATRPSLLAPAKRSLARRRLHLVQDLHERRRIGLVELQRHRTGTEE